MGRGIGEKITNCDMGWRGGSKNVILRVTYFLNGPLRLSLVSNQGGCRELGLQQERLNHKSFSFKLIFIDQTHNFLSDQCSLSTFIVQDVKNISSNNKNYRSSRPEVLKKMFLVILQNSQENTCVRVCLSLQLY